MLNRLTKNTFKRLSFKAAFMFCVLSLSFLLVRCKSNEPENKGELLAKVGGRELYQKDVYKHFNREVDDAELTDFVQNWVEQQAVLEYADEQLAPEEKNFDNELELYKNSLLLYALEEKIIEAELNTEVPDTDVIAYYQNNQKNFELKQNIVRVRYVKVSKKNKDLNKIKYFIQYKDSSRQAEFFKLVEKHSLFCEVKDSDWTALEELKQLVPIKLYNDEHFLSNYKYTEAPDGDDLWVVYFTDHRLKDEVSPLELVKTNIISAIINNRKIDLLRRKRKEFYHSAKKKGQIELYLKQ